MQDVSREASLVGVKQSTKRQNCNPLLCQNYWRGVLVNNATHDATHAPFDQLDAQTLDASYGVNIRGAMLLRGVLPSPRGTDHQTDVGARVWGHARQAGLCRHERGL